MRQGFALPLAILALVAVGLVLTAAIHFVLRPVPELPVPERAIEAFYLAETGLNTVLAEWRPAEETLRVWGPPEVRTGTTAQGRWEVEVRRVGEEQFFVRSTGVAGGGVAGPAARRTIGVAAEVEPLEPWTVGGLQHTGPLERSPETRIESEDAAPPGWTGAACAAVAASEVMGEDTGPEVGEEEREAEPMNWESLRSLATLELPGGTFEDIGPRVDATGCDRTDPMNWGAPLDPDGACGAYLPVVSVDGDAFLQGGGSGQGTLVVDGDLTIDGPFVFYGTVLVRGALHLSGGPAGAPTIVGAVRVENPDREALRFSGPVLVQNSRCAVGRAILGNDRLRRIRPVPTRAWVDLTDTLL